MTLIRGVDYGPTWGASGVQGFFGEGYWFHHLVPGLDFQGCTFVSKTTTLFEREGNMPLKKSWRPQSLIPKCVIVKPFKGVTLNSVGLTGPGAESLFAENRWQTRKSPFLLSFMSVAPTKDERVAEAGTFAELLLTNLPDFQAPVALQVNLSCPNTGHDPSKLAEEAGELLNSMSALRKQVPLIAKVNALFSPEAAVMLQGVCDGVCISNTIPWPALPDQIDWDGLFNQATTSPLKARGFSNGGLGGAPLLPIVADWVDRARAAGFSKHINAGGGILKPRDVDVLVDAGADSVFLGSIAMLRGWRLSRTIRHAHTRLRRKSL